MAKLLFTIDLEMYADPVESGMSADHLFAVYETPDGIEVVAEKAGFDYKKGHYDVPSVCVDYYPDGSVYTSMSEEEEDE